MDWHQREFLRLQSKAKQWLEAVTGQEIRAEDSLTDLLANGVVLKSAGRKIKRLLNSGTPIKDNEKSEDKERRLSIGAYTPYNNIDEFISVCKTVGVLDIDLFVPSDVVERTGDLRMLVLCIRALSKKCRAMDLPVPDFDNVAGFHKQSTPDGSIRGTSDIERFPSLVMPPVVDRESSLTPEKSLSVSEHELGGIRRLDMESPSSEPSSTQMAEKPSVAEETILQPFESGIKSSQFETEKTSEIASDLLHVMLPVGESGIVKDEFLRNDEAPSSPRINSSASNNVSSDILGKQRSSATIDNGGHVSGNQVEGIVAAPVIGSETEAVYPSRANNVDDLEGGSKIVVTNKIVPGEVSKKADESDEESDIASKATDTKIKGDYSARSMSQGRKSVDELQGGSYIVVTNAKKRESSTKGLSTIPRSHISDNTAGVISKPPPPVLPSNAVDMRVTDASSRTTTPAKVEKVSGYLPPRVIYPAIQSSGSDRGLENSSSKPAELSQSTVPEVTGPSSKAVPESRGASSTAVSPPTPSRPLDGKSPDVSATVGPPPPVSKNSEVAVRGPASVGQSPRVDTKIGDVSKKTVWPPVPTDRKTEDITLRSRSSGVNDRKGGDIPSRPTPLVAKSGDLDNKVGSLATTVTSPLAQSKSTNKEEGEPPVVSSKRLWIPIVAGAFALVGTFLAFRFRGPASGEYQVKEGDTLYGISKKTGKENWEDLARMNQISNPDLIYPSNRLKLN